MNGIKGKTEQWERAGEEKKGVGEWGGVAFKNKNLSQDSGEGEWEQRENRGAK